MATLRGRKPYIVPHSSLWLLLAFGIKAILPALRGRIPLQRVTNPLLRCVLNWYA